MAMGTEASRRRFIVQTAQGAAAASCVGLLWHVLLTQQARAATPLRDRKSTRLNSSHT